MEFIIQRASGFYDEEIEIPEAHIKETIKDDKKKRSETGRYNIYAIEINSIEQLMELTKKYGDVIIGNENFFFTRSVNDKRPTITIYDGYIE